MSTIKPWKYRPEAQGRFSAISSVEHAMQAEIDDLRAENAAILRNNKELLDQRFELMEQVGKLNAENAKLHDALQLAKTMLQVGMPEYGADDALDVIKAALEKK